MKINTTINIRNNVSNIYTTAISRTEKRDVMFGEVEDMFEGTLYSSKGVYRMTTPWMTSDYDGGTMSEFVVVSAMPNPSDLNSQADNFSWQRPGWNLTSTYDLRNYMQSINQTLRSNIVQATNFTNDNTWTSYGSNGWKYKYESKVCHPFQYNNSNWHGAWVINLWISNSNWTGYTNTPFYNITTNRFYFNDHSSIYQVYDFYDYYDLSYT